MIFKAILNNTEPFALDLNTKPWRVQVRAQVILGFVALGVGKGGLFITTFLFAMAWSEEGWLGYAIPSAVVTLLVMIAGYIAVFGRIEAHFDTDEGLVHLTKRIPFYRQSFTEPLANYVGIELRAHTDSDKRITHTLVLSHTNDDLNIPLWRRRIDDIPTAEWQAYAAAFETKVLSAK